MKATGLENSKSVAYFEYDFSKHGGAVGDIAVTGDVIPKGAIITGGMAHVKVACASGGSATVAAKAINTADVMAAQALANLTLNARRDVVPNNTAANSILLTSNLTALTFTIGTAALTAGKIVIALDWIETA